MGISTQSRIVPACRMGKSGATSILDATDTQITGFDFSDFATVATMDDNASGITIPKAGVYLITYSVEFASNATGVREAVALIWTSPISSSREIIPAGSAAVRLNGSAIQTCAAGDRIGLRVRQTSGGALDANTPRIAVAYLGPS